MESPWAYHWAGRPDRTAEVVHAAVNQQFGIGRGGLPGNDDSGGLSSWYVWASLGLFPIAGQDRFLVNAPSFEHARINIGGSPLTIETHGFVEPEPDGPAQYVQRVELDGIDIDRSWFAGSELRAASRLVIELGDRPSAWGTTTRPPSVSDLLPALKSATLSKESR